LEIDTSEPPEPGTKLTVDGAEAGEIVSAAYSPALGKSVAMAYMRTQSAEPGAAFQAHQANGRVRVPPQT
jgi:glycine cleavage system aminomethyltransferase T